MGPCRCAFVFRQVTPEGGSNNPGTLFMSDLSPTILITRPAAAAERFVAALRAAGINTSVIVSPLLQVVSTAAVPSFAGFSGVIFTSVNGVEVAPAGDLPAWCVGEATAAAARAKGWRAIAAGGDAETLVAKVLEERPQGPLLHLRGQVSRGDVAARLSKAGIPTREMIVYDQELRGLSDQAIDILTRENPVIVPLFSPRTAAQFGEELAKIKGNAPVFMATMSGAVAEAAKDVPVTERIVAAQPDVKAMIDAVLGLMDAVDNVED